MSSVWGRSLSHRNFGNVLDTPKRIEINWALKFWIARSDALRRCMLGGTSWKVALHFSSIWSLYAALNSLSRIWRSASWRFFWRRDIMRSDVARR